MIREHDNRSRIFEQAVAWVSAFQDGSGDRAGLFAWLAESPRHAEELSFALALSDEIAALTPQQRTEIETMAAAAGLAPNEPNVIPLQEMRADPVAPAPAGKATNRWKRTAALAAATVILSVGIGILAGVLGEPGYATRIGELRSLQLPDGSIVHLNARSRIDIRFNEASREIRLVEGEALFVVERDPARPFRVRADETVVEALGTQFNVQKRPSGTVVSVLEGIVQVSETVRGDSPAAPSSSAELLEAGDEVRIERNGRKEKRAKIDLSEVTAWQQRQLVFKGDTLADIAAEFNRYNVSPQIHIDDEEVRKRHFGGTFDANAPDALIDALRVDPTLRIESGEDEIVVRRR